MGEMLIFVFMFESDRVMFDQGACVLKCSAESDSEWMPR